MLFKNNKRFESLTSNKMKCLILSLIFLFIYFMDTSFIASYFHSYTFNYIIRLGLWVGLFFIIRMLPKAREHGKFKLKPMLNLWAFNFAAIFIAISGLCGFIYGFSKSPYSHSLEGVFLNFLMIGSMIAAKEGFRSYLTNSLAKSEHSALILLISIFMTFTDLSLNRYLGLIGYKNIVQFSAQYLLQSFAINLMASYLTYWGGASCSMIYMGTIQGFQWLSPVLPSLNWIISSLAGTLCAVFSLMSLQNIYLNEAKLIKERQKSKDGILGWILASVCSITIVWFTAGVFSIYPSVIATGSMKPMINPGDITLNKRVNTDSLNIGDVIQFKRGGILISHRIVDLVENNNEFYFKTKGDNNSFADSELVSPKQVKGKVIKTIPKAGWVTLFIKSKENKVIDKVQL